MTTPMAFRLAARVKHAAEGLGFPLAGIAPAAPPPRHEYLLQWLDRGFAGEMLYLARDPARRADPRLVLPGAQSVIMVGAPYRPPGEAAGGNGAAGGDRSATSDDRSGGARGRVSAYARGGDYHDLIESRLAALSAAMDGLVAEALAGVEPVARRELLPTGTFLARSYVDHGPLLERPLAARAGLGWIGKNTLLLHRRHGSWFFLGSLVTTLALPADREEADHCGSCRRCLDACPTAAFPEPWVLDSRRCISYLTIELRGAIPREFRLPMGSRVFGCDDCQTVCPWTPRPDAAASAAPGRDPDPPAPLFAPRDELSAPFLVSLLEMGEAEFERRFGATPLRRARRRGLRRNAAVALGNTGDRTALPALERALRDGDAAVRAEIRAAIDADA